MRPISKVIGVVVFVLLGCAWAWGAALAASAPELASWWQVCSDHSIPCSNASVSHCLRCQPPPVSTTVSTPAATPEPIVVSGGGGYGPDGIKLESDGTFRFATQAELDDLNQQLNALIQTMPEPTVERDRLLADIFGRNGFVFDQSQILQNAANNGGLALYPEDTVTIMQIYQQLGLPDVAVDYGNWATNQLPAFEIATPFGNQYYFDYYAQPRVNIFKEAQDALSLATDLSGWQEQMMAFDEAISVIEQQLDESQFTGMVLIPADQ